MDEDSQEEKPPNFVILHRNPAFTKEEVKVLVSIIEKYKTLILNKATNAAANHAKECAWSKVTKIYNNQGFKHPRSADCLKTKWENLKKDARKVSKNLMDVKYDESNDLISQIVMMMSEAEKWEVMDLPLDLEELETDNQKEEASEKYWNDDKHSDDSGADGDNENMLIRGNRSLNFSPQECSLLLQCVKEEKKHVFSRDSTTRAIRLKNRAWSRITESFNKRSPQKRTTKVLRTKFGNMKKLTKNINFKQYFVNNQHEKLDEENDKNIKPEPNYDCKSDLEVDHEDDNDDDEQTHDVLPDSATSNNIPDPLSAVLNGDSGIGSSTFMDPWNSHENKDVVKLKTELLNYKLETAKLERKRIEEAIKADAAERESMAIERALKLRAARLAVVAAELKLPTMHPALPYTFEETRAQHYMNQYQHP